MAVFDVNAKEGLTLVEKHEDVLVEDVVKNTECDFKVRSEPHSAQSDVSFHLGLTRSEADERLNGPLLQDNTNYY